MLDGGGGVDGGRWTAKTANEREIEPNKSRLMATLTFTNVLRQYKGNYYYCWIVVGLLYLEVL